MLGIIQRRPTRTLSILLAPTLGSWMKVLVIWITINSTISKGTTNQPLVLAHLLSKRSILFRKMSPLFLTNIWSKIFQSISITKKNLRPKNLRRARLLSVPALSSINLWNSHSIKNWKKVLLSLRKRSEMIKSAIIM